MEDNPSWPNSSVEDSRKDEAAGLPKPTVKGAPMSLTYCLLYCGIGQLIETCSGHDASIVHCKKKNYYNCGRPSFLCSKNVVLVKHFVGGYVVKFIQVSAPTA